MGDKGGDQVASLFMMYLKEKGWLKEDVTGLELTIIMDNYPSQNKNNAVIQLAVYLAKAKYFKKVTCVFYIAGHMKNNADCWFNTLKKNYRKRNIFIYKMLVENFKTNPRITISSYVDGSMKKWRSFCNQFLKTKIGDGGPHLVGGYIEPNHLFVVEEANPTTMTISRNSLVDTEEIVINLRMIKIADPVTALKERRGLLTIPEPGIPKIVQNELFVKWRSMVDNEYRDIVAPYLGPEVIRQLKDRTNKKSKEKRDTRKKLLGKTTTTKATGKKTATKGKRKKAPKDPPPGSIVEQQQQQQQPQHHSLSTTTIQQQQQYLHQQQQQQLSTTIQQQQRQQYFALQQQQHFQRQQYQQHQQLQQQFQIQLPHQQQQNPNITLDDIQQQHIVRMQQQMQQSSSAPPPQQQYQSDYI